MRMFGYKRGKFMITYPDCSYYENCPTTLSNWVADSGFLSWSVNVFIVLATIGTIWWGVWFCFVYLRRPFCADCNEVGDRTRAKYQNDGHDVCGFHWDKRDMAKETVYKCPEHQVDLEKVKYEGVTIDRCPHGCIFLNNGELEELQGIAVSSGQTTGMLLGIAIG